MKLGNEYLVLVKPESYKRAQEFLREFFDGDVVVDNDRYFVVRDGSGVEFGVSPDSAALTEKEYENSVWLSFVSTSFQEDRERLNSFGAREVEGGDPAAFFFSFPGGPVIKLLEGKG